MDHQPNTVDVHIGLRIRDRRRALGISQQALGEALGQEGAERVSFQQVQKYEKGTNRVSGSNLWAMARALRTDVSYFFEGLPDHVREEPESERAARSFRFSSPGARMCAAAAALAPSVALGFTLAMEAAAQGETAASGPPQRRLRLMA